MSEPAAADPGELILGLVKVAEGHDALFGDMLEVLQSQRLLVGEHERRVAELEEAWASLTLEVGNLTRRARLLVNMKATTLTLTCERCGAEFAKEPGPHLCGPCWCELGKPERYLQPADPA